METSAKSLPGRLLQLVIIAVFVALFSFSHIASAAGSASLSLSPSSSTLTNGSTVTLNIYENSGSTAVNAVQANLSYSSGNLSFVSISSSNAFPINGGDNSGGGGSVKISRATSGSLTGSQLVASVKFKALSSSGTATVSFAGGSEVDADDGNGTNILTSTSGGNYKLVAPAPAAPASPAAAKNTTPPTITKVSVSPITFNSATVTWTTSEPASSEIDYGLNKTYGLTAADSTLVSDHKLTLSSSLLTPATLYHFVVKSTDGAGNTASSSDATFTVKGLSLPVKVIDQKNKPVGNAKVTIAGSSSTTDSSGKTTVYNLPVGQQFAGVLFRGKLSTVPTQIKDPDANGQASAVTLKIDTNGNTLVLIIAGTLMAILILGGTGWLFMKHKGGPPSLPNSPLSGGTTQPPSTIINPGSPSSA